MPHVWPNRRPTIYSQKYIGVVECNFREDASNGWKHAQSLLLYSNPPKNMTKAKGIMDDALATAMYAILAVIATSPGSVPGDLTFGRDMLLSVPLLMDWKVITHKRAQKVNENLRRENAKRRSYDYEQGQKFLKLVFKPTSWDVEHLDLSPLNVHT